jgi:hypothetical protein
VIPKNRDNLLEWPAIVALQNRVNAAGFAADNVRTKDAIYPSTKLSKINLPGQTGGISGFNQP